MDTTDKPLLTQLEEEFQSLRAKDSLIGRYEREMQRHTDAIRRHYQLRKIAGFTMKKHEEWIREEAAANIRQRHSIPEIPGFKSQRQKAKAFRMRLDARMKEAQEVARKIINAPQTPPQP